LQEAGTRIDPPPSDACAIGTMPPATAAAAPPEEPPAERSRFKAEGLRLRAVRETELRTGRLGEYDEPGAFVARNELTIDRRAVVFEGHAAGARDRSGQLHAKILDDEGNALERTGRNARGNLRPSFLVMRVRDAVELRIDRLDVADRPREKLGRRSLAAAYELGETERVVFGNRVRNVALPSRSSASRGRANL
jgi:hypothetical protein